VTDVALGSWHTCAVDEAGTPWCWGRNNSGQLGQGTAGSNSSSSLPLRVTGDLEARSVAAGEEHSCVVLTDGTLRCWGDNGGGQVGDDSRIDRPFPTAVQTGLSFSTVRAAGDATCALATGGSVHCWGDNNLGYLGVNAPDRYVTTPQAITGGRSFLDLASSGSLSHHCGITNGGTYCWGYNGQGQVGDGTTSARTTPTLVEGGRSFTQVTTGWRHSCGVTADNTAFCWGYNQRGQLGNGLTTTSTGATRVPGPVVTQLRFKQVAAGDSHSCGLAMDDRLYCWGYNIRGQVGDGTTATRTTPVAVDVDETFTRVVAREDQTCAIATDGTLYCWGANTYGQLGFPPINGATTRPVPVARAP
jgi:alpha-tubulin suppressor-like RCC1 family protein